MLPLKLCFTVFCKIDSSVSALSKFFSQTVYCVYFVRSLEIALIFASLQLPRKSTQNTPTDIRNTKLRSNLNVKLLDERCYDNQEYLYKQENGNNHYVFSKAETALSSI